MSSDETFKRKLFEMVEVSTKGDVVSLVYDIMVGIAIVVGLIPLTIKGDNYYTRLLDVVLTILFVGDYLIRLYTADYKMGIKSRMAYLGYIVSPMAIIDLLSILPVVTLFFPSTSAMALLRLLRVLRVFKLIRYSKSATVIENVLRKVKSQLIAIFGLALIYMVVVAMIMFQIEPELFTNFADAIYWAGITVLGVGYGDITPVSHVGKMLTFLSALIGVAIIALPTGLISAAYIDELKRTKSKYEK